MAEAENRINEFLEEKVKEDREEKEKKERSEAELSKSRVEQPAQDKIESHAGPSGVTPQGNTTQWDQPRSKRETSARASRAEEEHSDFEGTRRKTGELGPPPVAVHHAASQGASSSSQGPSTASNKRSIVETEPGEGEAPEKAQKICSIYVGYGAADKIGDVKAKEYDEDLKAMVQEYRARNAACK